VARRRDGAVPAGVSLLYVVLTRARLESHVVVPDSIHPFGVHLSTFATQRHRTQLVLEIGVMSSTGDERRVPPQRSYGSACNSGSLCVSQTDPLAVVRTRNLLREAGEAEGLRPRQLGGHLFCTRRAWGLAWGTTTPGHV
jgi:hypothetical protein